MHMIRPCLSATIVESYSGRMPMMAFASSGSSVLPPTLVFAPRGRKGRVERISKGGLVFLS